MMKPNTSTKELNKDTLPVLKGTIIGVFEDYLSLNGIRLNNPERDAAIMEGNAMVSIIYGSHYDIIGDVITNCLIAAPGLPTTTNMIIECFIDLLDKHSSKAEISSDDELRLRMKISSILLMYGYKKGATYDII